MLLQSVDAEGEEGSLLSRLSELSGSSRCSGLAKPQGELT